MSRASRLLQRLVVVGAGTAAIATGVVPIATGVANAGAGDNATTITLTPPTVTDTVNNCTPYKVQTNPNAQFDVQISQASTGTTTIGFCDVSNFAQFQNAGDNPVSGPNAGGTNTCPNTVTATNPATSQTARCDAQSVADASGDVEFGVTSDTAGTMNVVAYVDQNANDQSSNNETPNDQSTETWVANQGGTITCEPVNQTQEINQTAFWNCTVTTSQGSGVNANGLNVYYDVNSGPDATNFDTFCPPDTSNSTGSGGGFNGVYNCDLSNGGGIGNDNITTFVDNNGNSNFDPGEPSFNTHIQWVSPAANNAVVQLDCDPNEEVADTVAEDGNGSYCQVTPGQSTVDFTATVTAGGAPQSGVVVYFYENYSNFNTGSYTLSDNAQCLTNAAGQCTITLTATGVEDGDFVGIGASDTNHNSDTSEVDWITPTSEDARNVTVDPADSEQPSGGSQILTATVTNRFDEPVQGVCLAWTETGPGRFANPSNLNCINTNAGVPSGAADTTCATNANGQCTVEVSSNETEASPPDEVITATIDSANYSNPTTQSECTAPADRTYAEGGQSTDTPPGTESDGADAGNCSDAGNVTWTGVTTPPTTRKQHPALNCWSPKRHVLKCKVVSHPRVTGAEVKFRKVHKDGTFGHILAVKTTDGSGVAKFKKRHIRSGKVFRVVAHVAKTAAAKGGYSNVDKTRIA